ncbi:DNA-binding transcriptional regulator, MerR family [Streptomyces sp. DvalAA-14]|uniref:MerR family transcriptional regulator n=1 Tax=unclassified Streptomyces TaxID=2593676 RepID=UPI00081BC037|nr:MULTISPECIES: MerR family transcriptional regulator [unclassified Streptomyces]MYS18952.1 MerR family transcriptional regulator [Streptomyces sp. SID4948]SCD32491.1 DNA-binding transcriptional regulator, MerR family [Streptomyces sp. DvalAA-14]
MAAQVPIGAFSVMTGLSRKTLRHYHEAGLLEPASIDPVTGYRHYDTSQVRTAEIIRRFRTLDMPVPQVKAVLAAPDAGARNAIIAAHLRRMEDQLDQTRQAVGALRELLDPGAASARGLAVEVRAVPALRAAAISATVRRGDLGAWWTGALDELYGAARAAAVAPTGPAGGLWAPELFADEEGAATLYLPVGGGIAPSGRVAMAELPAAELAVALHEGPHADAGHTYAELGTFVAERLIAVDGPVREHYLVGPGDTADHSRWRTEICWPVLRTAAG